MKLFNALPLLLFIAIGCKENAIKKTVLIKNDTISKKIPNPKINDTISREIIDPELNDTIKLGDINGDLIIDTAFVYTPPTLTTLNSDGNVAYTMGCVNNNCYNRIKFSCKLPDITIEESVWGKIEKIADLNNDGINEILFSTEWFTTTKSHLMLYSFNKNKWKLIATVAIRYIEGKPLKSHFVKTKHGNFLKGIEQVDGDEVEILKEIKF